jgi:hypothetical protein
MGSSSYPPWPPELAPSDYHLFLSLRNYLYNKHYEDFDELKSDLTAFFESKPVSVTTSYLMSCTTTNFIQSNPSPFVYQARQRKRERTEGYNQSEEREKRDS